MKVGIALSGGGIRGIAHAGVLKALEDNDIHIDVIGGTSSGSLIASLYAMGYSPYGIYLLFKRNAKKIVEINTAPFFGKIKSIVQNQKNTINGLKSGEEIEEIYNRFAAKKGINKVEDISMPIVIPTVDVSKSREYIFTNRIPENADERERYITDVSIGTAVRASSSFPAIFSPCNVEGHAFLDGGALNNIPVVEVRKQGADKVIAVKFDAEKVDENSNMMDIVMKTIDIMGNKISEESIESSDFVLNVYTDKVGLLDVKKLDKCFEYGYQAVEQNIEKIKEILKS